MLSEKPPHEPRAHSLTFCAVAALCAPWGCPRSHQAHPSQVPSDKDDLRFPQRDSTAFDCDFWRQGEVSSFLSWPVNHDAT